LWGSMEFVAHKKGQRTRLEVINGWMSYGD